MAKEFLEKLDDKIGMVSTASCSERRIFESLHSTTDWNGDCSIYRVPKPLRNVYSKAYTPQLISIGPLHRENKRLEAMEKEKQKYFKKLKEEKKRRDIVTSIKKEEKRLRNSYSEKFKKIESSDDFVEMILLDAVFIILFFLESNDEKGPKRFKPRMTFDIREDLMLLENQLPLFIIEKIYDKVSYQHSSVNKPKSFLDLATYYLREYLHLQVVETSSSVKKETGTSSDIETGTSSDIETGTRHLTDLLRNLMLSRAIQRTYRPDLVKLKYSAIMLHKAGVKFQVTRDECLVNITFDKGVLTIPCLKVDHKFERLVRNVMAMEECLYEREAYICSYIKFMDHLIFSAEDVGLLVRKGIILHRLGDDAAVSYMINHLCKNIGENDTCFGDISERLNAHYDENPWNRRNEPLKLVYFPNIWRGTATVASAILLILTFIQTICSVKSVS